MSLSIPILNKIELHKLAELSERVDQLEQKAQLYNSLNIIVAENALLKNRISILESQLSAAEKARNTPKKKAKTNGTFPKDTGWMTVKHR